MQRRRAAAILFPMPTHTTILRSLLVTAAASLATGCSLHSTATDWNGVVGMNGQPIHVRTTTNIGLNLGIVLPVLGNTSIGEMIDESTAEIARTGSNKVRVYQTTAENYWYGFPPLTWIFTPVITTVSVDYEPSAQELEEIAKERAAFRASQDERSRGDNRHVIPDRRPEEGR